jgi:predicted ATPase
VSLPSARSSFVGRIDEIARTRRALEAYRLVTLTGVGGCGKTRLAVETASRVAARYSDGVRFVDLARIGEDAGVAESLAVALDFVPDSAGPVGPQVRRRLGDRTQLLVVDNCEHVIDEVAEQIDALLQECPNARVLATSREPLDVDGERILRVPPLDLDGGGGRSSAEMLFVERMIDLGVPTADDEPGSPSDDEAIAAICRRLDGLPLAIELAAARTSVLSPAQILQRLDDRFSLLTGGRRRTRGRHQTLEATIGWSFELLDEDERDALRRISVMPAAFDLELAVAVLDRSPGATLDLLDALVARSLLQSVRDDEGGFRFRLLETVRSYAHDRLSDHGDVEATRDRHARHVAERLDELGISFQSMRRDQGPIADDVLAAIDWAKARGDRALAADLLAGGLGVAIARGAYRRALDVAAWATTADDPLVRSRAHLARGYLAMVAESDHTDPARCADAALEAAGDHWVSWRATAHVLGMIYSVLSRPGAFAEHARLARAAIERGECTPDTEARLAWLEVVRELWQNEITDPAPLARLDVDGPIDELTLVNLLGVGLLAPLFAGDAAAIERELLDATAVAARRRFLDAATRGEHWTLSYEAVRGAAVAMLGRVDEARRDLAEALRCVESGRMPGIDEDFLGAFAWACIAAGETTRAADLLDDTWVIARSPTTIVMITAGQERALGLPSDPERRMSELFRRIRMRDVISGEGRARRMLDDELARLGLTN